MSRMISYPLEIINHGKWIELVQSHSNGDVSIIISPEMIDLVCSSLQKIKSEQPENSNISNPPSIFEERESSAKEKEVPSFYDMEPVKTDEPMVTLTEEKIRAGLTKGVGINKMQQHLLGLPSLHSGWIQELIGKDIKLSDYNDFLNLQGYTTKGIDDGQI